MDNQFIALFTMAAKGMRSAADAAMIRHGVRVGQNLVLAALWEAEGQTPSEVAHRLHVTTPTVVKMTSRMEAMGLVTRRLDARDARLVRLFPTRRGRELRRVIESELAQLEARATADFTEAERRHTTAALRKMVTNLQSAAPVDETEELD